MAENILVPNIGDFKNVGIIEILIKELRKLISPFEEFNNDKFIINLSFTNSPFDNYS